MTVINPIKHFKFFFALLLLPLTSFSQEVPCREWYYTTDNNGNKLKGRCSEAYQVNSDGQKHGKLIDYYENGNPEFIVTFSNGVRNGSFRKFKEDGVTILVQGNFLNGDKVGKWKWTDNIGFLIIDYDNKKQISYYWKNLILKSNNEGGATGDLLFQFRLDIVDFQPQTGTIIISVNGDYNYHHNFTHIASNGWNFKEDIEQRTNDLYNITLSKEVINEIIQKVKGSKNIPIHGFAVLNFSKGNINSNVPYKIYDSNGRLLN